MAPASPTDQSTTVTVKLTIPSGRATIPNARAFQAAPSEISALTCCQIDPGPPSGRNGEPTRASRNSPTRARSTALITLAKSRTSSRMGIPIKVMRLPRPTLKPVTINVNQTIPKARLSRRCAVAFQVLAATSGRSSRRARPADGAAAGATRGPPAAPATLGGGGGGGSVRAGPVIVRPRPRRARPGRPAPAPGSDSKDRAGTPAGTARPSTLSRGMIRFSQRGSHQFARPSSSMVAGTSTMRTSVASMSTATARPRPMSLMARSSATTKLPNTHTMMAAAAVITRAVDASPSTTARLLSPERSYSSLIEDSRNTS